METIAKTAITVRTTINAPVEEVWSRWTEPRHIVRWNNASGDWLTTYAINDLKPGGRFMSRMESLDGSEGFDFSGTYTKVETYRRIAYTMDDDRKAEVTFTPDGDRTIVDETFETEQTNPVELQRQGWQSILDNFRNYAENSNGFENIQFEVSIHAPVGKVYRTMIDPKHYSEWTSEFSPTSRFEGSWNKGSKILFLGEDEEGNAGGMVGRIRENIPNKYISIEYNGILKDGQEVTEGPEVERWIGGLENYKFIDKGEYTIVAVDSDCTEEMKSFVLDAWPRALDKLKAICES